MCDPDQRSRLADLDQRLRAEVETVHTFISAWFRGEVERSDRLFQQQLAGRLAPDMVNIQPSGRTLTRRKRSPDSPPVELPPPSPLIRTRVPVFAPAGILTSRRCSPRWRIRLVP